MEIQRHPVKSKYCKLRLLCRSLAGNNVYYLTVTSPTTDEQTTKVSCANERSQFKNKNKFEYLSFRKSVLLLLVHVYTRVKHQPRG